MKKLISMLLVLAMLLGVAGAEETPVENVNLGHVIELTQRVDVLLRSDMMVNELCSGWENAISEEHELITRLRKGERTKPTAVYMISQAELEDKMISDSEGYTGTAAQKQVLSQMIENVIREPLSDYEADVMVQMGRATNYLLQPGEEEMGEYILLYEDALPMVAHWYTVEGIVTMEAMPLANQELAACTSAEEVTACLVTMGLPEMTCTAVSLENAAQIIFDENFFSDPGEPLSFELIAEVADDMEQLLTSGYLQSTWGFTDENVALMDDFLHNGEAPIHIYRLDMMSMSSMQLSQFLYRNEPAQVRYERMCTTVSDVQSALLQMTQNELFSSAYDLFIKLLNEMYGTDGDDESQDESLIEEEKKEDLFTDEETWEESYDQIVARYQEEYETQYLRYQMVIRSIYFGSQTGLSEGVPAVYLLIYETGSPIVVFNVPEFGVNNLDAFYCRSEQLQQCKSVTDVTLCLMANDISCTVTEILPSIAAEETVAQ